jgi:AbrB family looped-hinge helix DNA binding protein
METARLSAKGQVTIPIGIRRKLGLCEGGNIVFIERAGDVYITSENDVASVGANGWSQEFLSAFMRFGETADESFVEPDDTPAEYDARRVDFE